MDRRGEVVFELTVKGQPYGAGSKTAEPLGKTFKEVRGTGGRIVLKYRPASKFTKPWMEKVEGEAREKWAGRDPVDGALYVDLLFYEPRKSDHFYHRKSGDVLRPDAPLYPHRSDSHDVDKLRRAISDSLKNAGVIVDDKRIVGGTEWKLFADDAADRGPRCVIVLGRMRVETVGEAGEISPVPPGQETLT